MTINPDNPIKHAAQSAQHLNQVSKKAVEAVADKICDVDGDHTDLDDVKAAYQQLSPAEKVVLTAGGVLTGGALPVLSLAAEGAVKAGEGVAKGAEKMGEAIKEKYKHPPEEKLAEHLKEAAKKVGDTLEEAIDDLKDGRTFRDVKKSVNRAIRDTFSDRGPLEKLADKISDVAEDAADAASDAVDDIKDGRMGKKIQKAFD